MAGLGFWWWGASGGGPFAILASYAVEGQSEHAHEEVDSAASQVALRPTPVAVFDPQTGMGGHFEVAGGQLQELEAAFLKQRSPGP